MSDKKNIDRLFQEKLKDFEATPSDSVWENISSKLQSKRKGKRVIPIWWRVARVAANLLLLFTIGYTILNHNNEIPEENVVNTDSEDTIQNNLSNKGKSINFGDANNSENIANEDSLEKNMSNSKEKLNTTNKGTNSIQKNNKENGSTVVVANNSTNKKKSNRIEPNINKLLESKENNTVAQNKTNDNKIQNIIESKENHKDLVVKEQVNSALNELNKISVTQNYSDIANKDSKKKIVEDVSDIEVDDSKEKLLSLTEEVAANDTVEDDSERWKVASSIAPVYFNSFGKGSSIHPQFNNNSKTGDINMSYGVSGSYAISKKLSIRTGINKVNLGYRINDVVVYNNLASVSTNTELLRNIDLNEKTQNLSFISANEFNFALVPSALNNFIESTIDQQLGFIEIPLELEYKISHKKIGVNIIGGFSTLFLSNNKIYSNLNGNSTLLGKATNVNNTSYSANFGFGFDFKISKTFNFNLEPVFKYQINTFNDTSGNFKPYFIGVYSGFKFKF